MLLPLLLTHMNAAQWSYKALGEREGKRGYLFSNHLHRLKCSKLPRARENVAQVAMETPMMESTHSTKSAPFHFCLSGEAKLHQNIIKHPGKKQVVVSGCKQPAVHSVEKKEKASIFNL